MKKILFLVKIAVVIAVGFIGIQCSKESVKGGGSTQESVPVIKEFIQPPPPVEKNQVKGGGSTQEKEFVQPPPPVEKNPVGFIGTDGKRNINLNNLAELQQYKISIYNKEGVKADKFSAILITKEGKHLPFSGFKIENNYVVSDFLANTNFIAGTYTVVYRIDETDAEIPITVVDSDTQAPHVEGMPTKAEYKVGGMIDLVFKASDANGIDTDNTRIVEAKIGDIYLGRGINMVVPKITQISNSKSYEVSFSLPFPETPGLGSNTSNVMEIKVQLVDGRHLSGEQKSDFKTFTLLAVKGQRQEFILTESGYGKTIPLSNALVFYEIRPDVRFDGKIQPNQMRNLFLQNKRSKITESSGKLILDNVTPGDVVSFVIEAADGSGNVKQINIRSVSSSPLPVEFEDLPSEAMVRFKVIKYYNETLDEGTINKALLYIMPSYNEALGTAGRQKLTEHIQTLSVENQVVFETNGSGYVTFSPQDFGISAAAGVMYQLEIEGTSSNGSKITLKSRNTAFEFIPFLQSSNRKVLELEERD